MDNQTLELLREKKMQKLKDLVERYDEVHESDLTSMILKNYNFLQFLNEGFAIAPASTKYHGAYPGGLFDHSVNVFHRLEELTQLNHLEWRRPESPFIIGMFHDLCKCDQYNETENGYEYNQDVVLKGHGSKSVMMLSEFFHMTGEEILCIRYHMGAYEKDEWAELDRAIKICPNILYTHLADMLASKIDER